jgi:hypothetical protein
MTTNPRRFGIVVGVSEFDPNEHISKIPYAAKDAIRVYETLRDSCGFNSEQLYLFTSCGTEAFNGKVQPPTRPNILNALRYVIDEAHGDDLLLLYIASHGLEISNTPYLLTSDTRMNVVKETAIDTNEVNETLRTSKARCIIRVFDACRSPFAVARSSAGRMTDRFQDAIFSTGKGWATISSCSSGEYSYESSDFEQGVFSYYLCEGICGKATNADGNVTLEGLVEYVKTSLGNWSDRQTQKQTPHFQSDLSGVVVLSSPKPVVESTTSVSPAHPLSQLQMGLRDELAAAPNDARNLQFTFKDGMSGFAGNVNNCIEMLLTDFTDSAIQVTTKLAPNNELQRASHGAWQQFNREISQLKVKQELSGHPCATEVTFASSEVIIPSSTLIVACARFSFFYWLWYLHACDVPTLQNRFTPNPAFHTGFMTFKSNAAIEVTKVDPAVREMLSRCAEAIVDWTQQLRGFVDARLDPLRKLKAIIE